MNIPKWNVAVSLASLLLVLPARATIDVLLFGTSAPPAALGGYNVTPFGADPSVLGSAVTSVALPPLAIPSGSLLFDASTTHFKIGSGWLTWSNGYTGDVYGADVFLGAGPGGTDQLQITLPAGTHAFYFYVEPSVWDARNFNVSVTTHAGESVAFAAPGIQGEAGAAGFGLYTSGPLPSTLDKVTISALDTWPDGFAVGEFGIEGVSSAVPDSGTTFWLTAVPLLALAAAHRRFRVS